MSQLFDTKRGALYLDDGFVLQENLTPADLLAAGVRFNWERDTKTGWIWRMTGPHSRLVLGREAYFAFAFYQGVLKEVDFSFDSKAGKNADELHQEHNKVLIDELGPPDYQDDWRISYKFPWGGIGSANDTRGGGNTIGIYWE